MRKVEILVVHRRDEVQVRWLEPFDGNVNRALRETLLEVHGVESVGMRRYSAEIEVASHVTNAAVVAASVVEALSDRASEFQYALRFWVQEPEVDIVNAGEVDRL